MKKSLEMGPESYSLTTAKIDGHVTKVSAGNYALGYVKDDGTFIVQYVGRADSDINGRLKDHVGESFKAFKFSYATSPKAAFEKECENYHDFGESEKLTNKYHPDKPSGSNWNCPFCN